MTRTEAAQHIEPELLANLCDLAGVINETESDDVYPVVECSCCGNVVARSCYSAFTDTPWPSEAFSVLVRGSEYCVECAGELS